MLQSALVRQPLVIAGALGLLAGVLVAHEISTPTALAAEPSPAAVAGSVPAAPDQGGIVFLDSRPTDVGAPAPAPALSPAPAPATATATAPAPASGSGGFLRIVLMMTFLVGGAIAWYLTRRRQQGKAAGATRALSLVGTVKIAGRWQVALVKVPGKTLVLGATDKGLSLLSELDDDVALDVADRDELAARIRDDDTMTFSGREPRTDATAPRARVGRVTTDPLGARAHADGPTTGAGVPRPTAPPSEPFGRLLDQLTRGSMPGTPPPPTRERSKTDEALALRARLERHQPPN